MSDEILGEIGAERLQFIRKYVPEISKIISKAAQIIILGHLDFFQDKK